MHSHIRTHHSMLGFDWNPANIALTILITLLFLIFLFLFLALTAQPAQGQNSVPPTARQAATMPQFAPRLSHHAAAQNASRVVRPPQTRTSHLATGPACSQSKNQAPPRWMSDDNVLYTNGPVNGTTDAWSINFGFVVSDTFTVSVASGSGPVAGLSFYAWTFPGDVLQTAEISITSSEFGGTSYFDSVVNFTQSACSANQLGYNVCLETSATLSGPNLNNGTYWVNLENAVVNDGDPIFWDENSGVGCDSQGCPSLASENSVGTIPSEAFTVLGTTTTNCEPPFCQPPPPPCFQPSDGITIVHDFTASEGSPNGVTVDDAGNLYGPAAGGDYGAGMIFRLLNAKVGGLFTTIYNFLGGASGSAPSPLVLGPNGALYGIANGGIQNCGQNGTDYCGVIFRLKPSPRVCTPAACDWQEDVLYQFSGNQNGGLPENLIIDQAGNLYGTLSLPNYGTGVFELTPSSGSWTESLVYSFSSGDAVSNLVANTDGNLYGITGESIFQLVPSGGIWTENIIYTFQNQGDGTSPYQLLADNGSLEGISTGEYNCAYIFPIWFSLSPSNGGWTFSDYPVDWYGQDATMVTQFDSSGFTLTHLGSWLIYAWAGVGESWHTTDWFDPSGPLAGDFQHIYGTTPDCGTNNSGTLWRFPP